MLSLSSNADRQLASRSPVPEKPSAACLAYPWPPAGVFLFLCRISRIDFKGRSESMALECGRPRGHLDSNVQLQPFCCPLFEEFGWRGFLQPYLQEVLPPGIAAICVGIMWAAWHLPLFLVRWSSASPMLFALIEVGLSVIMATAFNASGRAVVVAILMHSAFNASSRFIPAFLGNVPTREHPSPELLIGLSFLLVAAATLIFTRGRLSAQSEHRTSM